MIVLILLLLMLSDYALATDYYATPSGGSSSATSCPTGSPCTLANAMNRAFAGDSVILKNGIYNTFNSSWNAHLATVRAGSSSGGRITIRAENRHQATIKYSLSDNSASDKGVVLKHDFITMKGFKIDGSNRAWDTFRIGGLTSNHSDVVNDITVEDVYVVNAGNAGITVHDLGPRAILRNFTIDSTGNGGTPNGSGIYTSSATLGSVVNGFQIHNGVVRLDRGNNMIDYKQAARNIVAHHNIFQDHDHRLTDDWAGDGLVRGAADPAIPNSGNRFYDSIVRNVRAYNYAIRISGNTVSIQNNAWYNMTASGSEVFIDSRTSSGTVVSGNITCNGAHIEEVKRGNNQHERPLAECITRAEAIVGVPSISSCEIGSINDNTLAVNLTTTAFPPISSVGTAGQLAVTYNGAAQAENSVTLASGNQARIVMASPPANSSVQVRVAAPAGVVRNSAFIGGLTCGSTLSSWVSGQGICGVNKATTGSGVLCTNNVGGGTPPAESLNQAVYRFYDANRAPGVGALVPENTNITLAKGSAFRWRVGVRGGGDDAPSRSYNLAARLCNPTCGAWSEVNEDPNTSGIVYSPDAAQDNLAETTNRLSLGGKSFLAGVFLEQPGGTPAVVIGSTRQIEWEFSLAISESSIVTDFGDLIELRIQHDDGTVLSAYTLASITLGAPRAHYSGAITGTIQ